jgi:DNA-binding PadR family transcriptional regulator
MICKVLFDEAGLAARRPLQTRTTMTTRDPSDFVPLGAPVLHVLLALGRDRLHGYAIMKTIEEETGGRAVILPGTLYSTLNRMEDDGLIVETDPPPGDEVDRRRRYYRTTEFGRRVVAAESERMEVLLEVARRQKLIRGSRGA